MNSNETGKTSNNPEDRGTSYRLREVAAYVSCIAIVEVLDADIGDPLALTAGVAGGVAVLIAGSAIANRIDNRK